MLSLNAVGEGKDKEENKSTGYVGKTSRTYQILGDRADFTRAQPLLCRVTAAESFLLPLTLSHDSQMHVR